MNYSPHVLITILLSSVLAGCVETSAPVAGQGMGTRNLYVLANVLNVRECPSTNCRKVSVLYRGDQVMVVNGGSGWYEVQAFGSGKKGWVSARYLADYPPAQKRAQSNPAKKSAPAMPEEEFGPSRETVSPPPVDEEFGAVSQDERPPAVEEEFGPGEQAAGRDTPPVVREEFAR